MISTKNKTFTLLALLILFLIITANIALAQNSYTELAPLPGTGNCTGSGSTLQCTVTTDSTNLGTYINGLYKLAVAGASVLAILMLIIGGFTYVQSDAISNKEEGKEKIKAALGGLLLVLASWVILYTVNPQLVSLKIITQPLEHKGIEDFLNFGAFARANYDAATIDNNINRYNASVDYINTVNDAAGSINEVLSALDNGLITAEEAQAIFEEMGVTEPGISPETAVTQAQNSSTELENRAAFLKATNDAKTRMTNAGITADRVVSGTLAGVWDASQANSLAAGVKNDYNTAVQRINATNYPEDAKQSLINELKTLANTNSRKACYTVKYPNLTPNLTETQRQDAYRSCFNATHIE